MDGNEMDEVFIICIAGTLCRLPRLGAVRIHSELSCFAPRLLLPPPRFFFLPRKLDGCFLSSVVPLFVVIFMRTPNRIFLVENRRSFNVWRKRTWDLGGDWKEREATKTPLDRAGGRPSGRSSTAASKNIVPNFLNHLILVFLFLGGRGL
jgi:hypothetical protein